MFTAISTASMLGIMASTYYFQNKESDNDHEKIKKIADNIGLYVTENKQKQSIRIYRKTKKENYSEYIYKIPLGLSFKRFEENKQVFIDGLNNKRDRKSTRLNSSHVSISYAVFCLKKKTN